MDGASQHTGAVLGLQLEAPTGEVIEHAIRLDFPASNNEVEYEAIIAGLDLVISVSSGKIIIRSDFQLVVSQVNDEYETRDQHMTKYVSLVNLRLGSFTAWQLEHVPRNSNKKANALAAIVASLLIKETMLLLVYYLLESSITANWVNEIDETSYSWMTPIVRYLCSRMWRPSSPAQPSWRIRTETPGDARPKPLIKSIYQIHLINISIFILKSLRK